jgi:hypothetical protein
MRHVRVVSSQRFRRFVDRHDLFGGLRLADPIQVCLAALQLATLFEGEFSPGIVHQDPSPSR